MKEIGQENQNLALLQHLSNGQNINFAVKCNFNASVPKIIVMIKIAGGCAEIRPQ